MNDLWLVGRIFVLAICSCGISIGKPPVHKVRHGENLNFLFFGDWGLPGENQTLVGHSMGNWAAQYNASFLIALGDNFYFDGVKNDTDPLWDTTYRNVYTDASLNIPWYVILGNHDYYQNPQAQIDYFYNQRDHRWTMPDHVYQEIYEIPNSAGLTLEIIFVDTAILAPLEAPPTQKGGIHEVTQSMTDKQLSKIEEYLSKSRATWLIVAGHYTIYSTAEHGDTAVLIRRLVPLMQRYGVQAYLNGHDHVLQHIIWHGIAYITSGQGALTDGHPIGNFDSQQSRPSIATAGFQFGCLGPGFATAQVTPDILTMELRDKHGEVVHRLQLANPRDPSMYPSESAYSSTVKYILTYIAIGLLGLLLGSWTTWMIFRYEIHSCQDLYEMLQWYVRGKERRSHNSAQQQQAALRRHAYPIPLTSAESSHGLEHQASEAMDRDQSEEHEDGKGIEMRGRSMQSSIQLAVYSPMDTEDNELV